jgi:hypothetical protein
MSDIFYDAQYAPTVSAFMHSDAFGRLIAGPVGSGKTTGCIFELLRRAIEQNEAPDGIRYTRFAIVRQTLKQLKDTVLKDILSFLGPIADYRVSEQTIHIRFDNVVSEWLMIPLDDVDDVRRLLSLQLTGAWLSESIEMDVEIIPALAGRCGRFPSAAQGGATWFGLIADTNMPEEGSPWHKFMETDVPPDWEIYKQPGGLTPYAENLEWLTQTPETLKLAPNDPRRRAQGRTYYDRLANSNKNSPNWVKRYVHALYGDDPSGSAVYKDSFKSSFHGVDELEPIPGMPLIIGQDFGRDPWSVICQLDHKGRLLVLQEVDATDIGLEQHIEQSLRPAIYSERYMGRPIAVVGDPAGISKSSIYEETTFDVMKRMGFMAFPAPTNNIDPRIRAVEAFLLQQRDGGPAFLVDKSRCPVIMRALGGGYRYSKTKAGQRKPTPDKNQFSHPMDALQYACLAANGGMVQGIIMNRLKRPQRTAPAFSSAAWT